MGKTSRTGIVERCIQKAKKFPFGVVKPRRKRQFKPLCKDSEFMKCVAEYAFVPGPRIGEVPGYKPKSRIAEFSKQFFEKLRDRTCGPNGIIAIGNSATYPSAPEPEIRVTATVNSPANAILENVQRILSKEPNQSAKEVNHPGFRNPRYLCYIISSVQLLVSSSKILNFFADWPTNRIQDETKRAVFNAFKRVCNHINDSQKLSQIELDNCILELGKFAEVKRLKQDEEQDPAEFLTLLFEFMNDETKNGDSISSIFRIATVAICTACKKELDTRNVAFIYPISLADQPKSIQALMEQSLRDEKTCCANASVESMMFDVPDVLLIQLKRSDWKGNKAVKNTVPVEISMNLKLRTIKPVTNASRSRNSTLSSVPDEDEDADIESGITNYELSAVMIHIGEKGNSGHYLTYLYRSVDQEWIRCSDQIVEFAEKADLESDEVYRNCSLLMYIKTACS